MPSSRLQYHSSGNTPCTHCFQRQKKCQYRPSGNPQPCCSNLVQTQASSQTNGSGSSHGQFWATQVQQTCPIATVQRSCTINSDFPSLQWNPGPARRNPTNIVSAACGRFSCRYPTAKPATSRTSLITFSYYTDNMDLAILLNKDTFEPDPTVSRSRPLHEQKYVGHGTTHRSSPAAQPVSFWHTYSHSARYTFTMLWPRNASTELLSSFMPECWSTC